MIRLLIADDHTLFRLGLRQMLHSFPGVEVVGEATDATTTLVAAREACARQSADLLLTDLTMPGTSGTRLLEQLHTECPALPVLVLSMHDEPAMVRRALAAGATGYITKEATPQILQAAIRAVAAGERYLAPALAQSIAAMPAVGDAAPAEGASLSPREWEVLRRIVAGDSLNQIADRLGLSPKTVTTHKSHLMEKLGVENNADLIRHALQHRLVE